MYSPDLIGIVMVTIVPIFSSFLMSIPAFKPLSFAIYDNRSLLILVDNNW